MGKNSIALGKKMSKSEVISFLESIVTSLKEGKIVLEQGKQFVALQPEKLITVEIEANQKMEKGKLSIDLKWQKPEKKQPEENIIVSSTVPEKEESIGADAGTIGKKHKPKGKKHTKKKSKVKSKEINKKKAKKKAGK
jgi:amphi-Trp domain-containing protein